MKHRRCVACGKPLLRDIEVFGKYPTYVMCQSCSLAITETTQGFMDEALEYMPYDEVYKYCANIREEDRSGWMALW